MGRPKRIRSSTFLRPLFPVGGWLGVAPYFLKDLKMIVDIDTATDDLMNFICYDAMAVNEDRLKALTNLRIIMETSNIKLEQIKFTNKVQREEIQDLKRKLTKARVK